MIVSNRIGSGVLIALAIAAATQGNQAVATPSLALAQDARPLKYVRATTATKLFNVADKLNGIAVATIPADTPLAVYAERSGWLSVEPPEGLQAWVYGQFLRLTPASSVAEVTGDGVRLRPKPSSSVDSFPLEQQLHEGDRVRTIGRANPSKPLREDWVQIVTPPGVRAWVQASDTAAPAPGVDLAAVYTAAAASAAAATKAAGADGATAPASGAVPAPGAASEPKPDTGFASAEALYEKAKADAKSADWGAVLAAYEGYLKAQPEGAHAEAARYRIREVEARGELARLQSALDMTEAQREQKLREAQAELEEARLSQDPLWGRFQARGWLERDAINPSRWVLVWAGKPTAELTCASGRYDLAVFQGKELGVNGVRQSAGPTGAPRLDAARIEVISVRSGG